MRCKKQINIEIGARIKNARESAKLTQEQFSELIDVSPQYISDMERGVVGISIPTFKRACSVLRVSSDTILFGSESNEIAAVIADKCKSLNDMQLSLLLNSIDNFILAVDSEKNKEKGLA